MKATKRKRLRAAGFVVGSSAQFLELSPEQAAFVELKLRLSGQLRERREHLRLTQGAVAKQLGSSQSRVAKMEAADPTVSIDLLVRALLALGASADEIAGTIRTRRRSNGR